MGWRALAVMPYPTVDELLQGHVALGVSWEHWARLVYQVIFSPDDQGWSGYARGYTITPRESRRLLRAIDRAENEARNVRSEFATLEPQPLDSFRQLDVLYPLVSGPWCNDGFYWEGCYGVCRLVIDSSTPVELQLRWMVDYLSSCAECQAGADLELYLRPWLTPRFHWRFYDYGQPQPEENDVRGGAGRPTPPTITEFILEMLRIDVFRVVALRAFLARRR